MTVQYNVNITAQSALIRMLISQSNLPQLLVNNFTKLVTMTFGLKLWFEWVGVLSENTSLAANKLSGKI